MHHPFWMTFMTCRLRSGHTANASSLMLLRLLPMLRQKIA